MIRSMTGFASLTREEERATIGVTVRSVNHRYLDVQVRVPHILSELEGRLRSTVQRHVTRGRIEVAVSVQLREPAALEIELNEAFVRALSAALDRARANGVIEGALVPGDLLRLPQALVIREQAEASVESVAALSHAVERAIDETMVQLDAMRVREGDELRADLDARRQTLADLIDRVAGTAEAGRAAFETRLADRVRELGGEALGDKAAIAQEIVRVAARSDISEEVVRFRSHLGQWAALSDGAEPCGRKLDFLLQEMNREVNTVGAKVDGVQVSELIVAAKAELEKMREQVQNVE
jgi:uncharacterized protein (TIGR00255 family)